MLGIVFRHPIISTIVAVVVIYFVWRFMAAPSGPTAQVYTSAGSDPNVVAAGVAIQQSQMAAASEQRQLEAALEAKNLEIGGQVTIAQLGQTLGLAQTEASKVVALEQLSAQREATGYEAASRDLASTLTAQIEQAGITANLQMAQMRELTTQQQIQALADIAHEEQVTTRSLIQTQGDVQKQAIKSDTKKTILGKATQFLFGGLF